MPIDAEKLNRYQNVIPKSSYKEIKSRDHKFNELSIADNIQAEADRRDLLELVGRMRKVIAIWESYFKEVSDAKGWFDHAMGKNRAKKFDAEVAALLAETEE